MNTFREVLRHRRSEAGLSQKKIERITGIPFQSISAYENGKREPHPVHRYALRMLFGLTEDADGGWWKADYR